MFMDSNSQYMSGKWKHSNFQKKNKEIKILFWLARHRIDSITKRNSLVNQLRFSEKRFLTLILMVKHPLQKKKKNFEKREKLERKNKDQ